MVTCLTVTAHSENWFLLQLHLDMTDNFLLRSTKKYTAMVGDKGY